MTIAISQSWYLRNGAKGAENLRGDKLKTIDTAAKTAMIVRVFESILIMIVVLA